MATPTLVPLTGMSLKPKFITRILQCIIRRETAPGQGSQTLLLL